MDRQSIALVAGSFKYPTKIHWEMMKFYSCRADYVVAIISSPNKQENIRTNSDGIFISPDTSKKIFDIYQNDLGLDNFTSVVSEFPSPVQAIMNYVSHLRDCDVIFGIGEKDKERYTEIVRDFKTENGVRILPVEENVFKTENPEGISGTYARNNIGNREETLKCLPDGLKDESVNKIMELIDNSEITETKIPEIEEIHLDITDDFLRGSERYINTWGLWKKDGRIEHHDPETSNPIDLIFKFKDNSKLNVFFENESGTWNSSYIKDDKTYSLSPYQFESFFKTNYYKEFEESLSRIWDLQDDLYYDLYDKVQDRKINVGCPVETITEDGEYKQGHYDRDKSKEKNVVGKQMRSASGRKLITPSDFAVTKTDQAKYFVWPESGKEFRWSQWNGKNKLLCRIKFNHADSVVGLSYSLHNEIDENRGFLSYVLEQGGKVLPPVSWGSPQECEGFLNLSFIEKFRRNALKRIKKYLDIPSEEIYNKINNKEKITIDDIENTKRLIQKNLVVLKEGRHDTFVYT